MAFHACFYFLFGVNQLSLVCMFGSLLRTALLVHDEKNAALPRIKVAPSLEMHEFTRECFVLIIELSKELYINTAGMILS